MSRSIRLRLVDWLKSSLDHGRQIIAEVLREQETHPKPCRDDGLRWFVPIDYALRQADVDDAVALSNLGYKVDKFGQPPVVNDFQHSVANAQYLAGLRDSFDRQRLFFLAHNPNSPQPKNIDLSTVNAKLLGVHAPSNLEKATS